MPTFDVIGTKSSQAALVRATWDKGRDPKQIGAVGPIIETRPALD